MNNTVAMIDVIKVFLPAVFAFTIGILVTPHITDFLYKHKFWKKSGVSKALGGGEATITKALHNDEERKTPRMGGLVVFASVILTTIIFAIVSFIFSEGISGKLNFLSRGQTWLPLIALIMGTLVGFVDDYLVVSNKGGYVGGGLSLKTRLGAVGFVALVGGWWLFAKLGLVSVGIPFLGEMYLGIYFIPFFIIFAIGIYSGGIIDGVDGLAGGVFSIMFGAYALIAFLGNQIDMATFCMVVVGGILAFLWFNIPPARFFLSETGTMGLTITLVFVAFLTKSVGVLPIIAFPLIATAGSSVIQIASKKLRHGKKVFKVAPLHNHFQAIGWPPYKVTMRYWIISLVLAVAGIIVHLVG
ncbi:MAG: hypothetical protein PHS95_00265 [Candidatus Pacebacteria bacterium]|nr:hypothetical protein [Candidatus Paceibacterota bacterium]